MCFQCPRHFIHSLFRTTCPRVTAGKSVVAETRAQAAEQTAATAFPVVVSRCDATRGRLGAWLLLAPRAELWFCSSNPGGQAFTPGHVPAAWGAEFLHPANEGRGWTRRSVGHQPPSLWEACCPRSSHSPLESRRGHRGRDLGMWVRVRRQLPLSHGLSPRPAHVCPSGSADLVCGRWGSVGPNPEFA